MTSMDNELVSALFAALGQAQAGRCGMFRIDASNPEGVQGIVFLALDDVAYRARVEPALRAGGVEVAEIKRGKS